MLMRFTTVFLLCLGLVQVSTAQSLDQYKPVVVVDFEQQPGSSTLSDTTGSREAVVERADKGLPKYVDGPRGKAWDFNGTDAYLSVMADEAMRSLGDIDNHKGYSVSFWMRSVWRGEHTNTRVMGMNKLDMVVGKGRSTGDIRFGLDAATVNLDYRDAAILFDGDWHHLACTADYTQSQENMIIYLDGKQVAAASMLFPRTMTTTDTRTRLILGARSNHSYFFNGGLDDVALFDYPLSAQQVAQIHAGDTFPGVDQTVYLPNPCTLEGIAPPGTSIQWSKKSGPGDVTFADATSKQTTAEFTKPGDYVLAYTVNGKEMTLNVTALPAAAPTIALCDPIHLTDLKQTAEVSATVSIPGSDLGASGADVLWSAITGPAEVSFVNPKAVTTPVRFTKPGLYTLRLTASHSGLDSSADLTVLVGAKQTTHYLSLLDPVMLFDFEQPPNRVSAGIVEFSGNTFGQLTSGSTLPVMTPGARPFTGYGWDFSQADTALQAFNRHEISRLGDPQQGPAFSLGFWVKGNMNNRDLGRVGGKAIGVMPTKFSSTEAGIQVDMDGKTYRTSDKSPNRNLFDDKWHHVLVTIDLLASKNNVNFYVDGKQDSAYTHNFTRNLHDYRVDHWWYIGQRNNGGGGFFQAKMDDFVLFDRVLTEKEASYIVRGPNASEAALLEISRPTADAGPDQSHPMSTDSITLKGNAESGSKATWRQVAGPGKARIANAEAATTKVTFERKGGYHNPSYGEYIFELSADSGKGCPGLIGRDRVTVVFYEKTAPVTRKFSATPAPGIHPRVLFAPEDLPAMRKRIKSDPFGRKAMELLKKRVDAQFGNSNNPIGHVYHQLKNGDEDVQFKAVHAPVADVYSFANGSGSFYGSLSGAAFIALLEDDKRALRELSKVAAGAAKAQLDYYRPEYSNALTHDASGSLGLAYDFLFNSMTEDQRTPVRELLSKMTHWRQSMGTGIHDYDNSTNWKTFHDHIVIASLAIEGEEGYDPDLYELNKHKLRRFTTQYGIFRSGYAHEGVGYLNFGLNNASISALAMARRDENLYETSNLYKAIETMHRNRTPDGTLIIGHGDTVGGLMGAVNVLWVARYLWPDSFAAEMLESVAAGLMDDKADQRGLNMLALLFATGKTSSSSNEDLPLTLFCKDKGYVHTRSDWTEDATVLLFRCRMDKFALGHMHPDINSFEFTGKGKQWFVDPGKFEIANDMHQTVLIDGIGGGGSSEAFTWPSLPGRFVEFKQTDKAVIGAGDAKPFYDYVHRAPSKPENNLHQPPKGMKVAPVTSVETKDYGLVWSDFMYDADMIEEMPDWRTKGIGYIFGYQSDGSLYTYNPVDRAFRTAAMVHGRYPFAIVVDDYDKDGKPHDYTWVANAFAGSVDKVSGDQTDLILKHADGGKARLLVRVLQVNGSSDGPVFFESKLCTGPKSVADVTQVRIESRGVVEPGFKVLLYAFNEGDPLPQTKMSGSQLTVRIGNEASNVRFTSNRDGRTQLDIR